MLAKRNKFERLLGRQRAIKLNKKENDCVRGNQDNRTETFTMMGAKHRKEFFTVPIAMGGMHSNKF
jgi:hypothetical protein